MTDTVALLTAIAALLTAFVAPMTAIRAAKIQAVHTSLLTTMVAFTSSSAEWQRLIEQIASDSDLKAERESDVRRAALRVLDQKVRLYLLLPGQTVAWLERHWMKRFRRLDSAVSALFASEDNRGYLEAVLEDYRLAMPTVLRVLTRAIGLWNGKG